MAEYQQNRIFFVCLAVTALLFLAFPVSATVQDEIAERQKQIEEIQRQIEQYESQIENTRTKSRTLENEISKLNAQINQLFLEIKSLELSIAQTNSQISETEEQISISTDKLTAHKQALGQYIKIAYENDRKSLTEILLKHDSLSSFFNELNNLQDTQDKLKATIISIKDLKASLENHQEDLEDKRSELQRLKMLEEVEKKSLDQNKSSKNRILKETKGQEAKFQQLIQVSQKNIENIRGQITYLAQNGVTAEEAIKFGQLAAIRTDIRPAYLIAVLEVESSLGRNVGRCNREGDPPEKNWTNIMHSRDYEPFKAITASLGLNIDTTPVSCPQYVNGRRYGWGGAMGPAQFIPSTWMGYKDEVAKLVNKTIANPWSIEDAFVAAAVKLARAGAAAKTRVREIAASKAYYSGNSKCSTAACNSYANAIQRKAAEIEADLN